MSRVVITLASLRSPGVSSELVKRLERAGLVKPLGRDTGGQVWVDVDARRQLERVQSLIAAGYAERDITLVIGRAERSARDDRIVEVIGRDELVSRARVGVELLDRWEASGALAPWARDEAGRPLYQRELVPLARAFSALEALGIGEHVAAWARVARGEPDEGDRELKALIEARLERAEVALKTLRKLLARLHEVGTRRPRRRLLGRARAGAERSS